MDSDANLLVSTSWKAPGRARREIVMRLRRLGDDALLVSQTDRKGVMTVRTALDPRVRAVSLQHDNVIPRVVRVDEKLGAIGYLCENSRNLRDRGNAFFPRQQCRH